MPTYEYKCKKCQTVFELSLSLKEKEDNSQKLYCPQCKATDLTQILSTNGILKHGLSKSCDPSPSCGGCCGGGQCPM